MATPLAELVDPAHTAVLTMECQRGIVGDLSAFTELVDAATTVGLPKKLPALVRSARTAGATVIHCTAERRPDGAGSVDNCRMLAGAAAVHQRGGGIAPGTPGAELIDGLGPHDTDLVVPRLHGLTPFTATSLDQLLRNLDVTTVVAVGASINIGILGLTISAVDLGYQVVVPRDAVAGVPVSYGETVLAGTIGLLATLTTVADLDTAWADA